MRYYGISAYAGGHKNFPYDRFMQQFPATISAPCTAFLCGCFGWKWSLLQAFCTKFSDRPHAVEFHISNGASRRSGRLGPGAFAQTYSVGEFNSAWEKGGDTLLNRQLADFLNRITSAIGQYGNPNTHVVISPELEDNMTDRAFKNFAMAIDDNWELVRSPCTGGNSTSVVQHKEVHGLTVPGKGQVGNMDGVSINFNDGEKFYSQCSTASAASYISKARGFMTMLWSANQQGLGNQSSQTTPAPPHKQRTFVVTDAAITGMRKLLKGF